MGYDINDVIIACGGEISEEDLNKFREVFDEEKLRNMKEVGKK